jgi:hypothetical protein
MPGSEPSLYGINLLPLAVPFMLLGLQVHISPVCAHVLPNHQDAASHGRFAEAQLLLFGCDASL